MTGPNSLSQALAHAIQQGGSVDIAESGAIDAHSVGLKIQGIGDVKLPLRPKDARELLASAEMAPYGKGTETILDKSVRDCLEVAASKITLSDSWDAAVQSAAREAAERLGLPADRVQARLYKLLIYPRGGFFLPHRDSEKKKGMVGSLVAMLPSPFSGGELIVQHGESRETFPFAQAAAGKSAEYVAFYADCQHEVRPVTRGVRVCLSYNLIVKPQKKLAGAAGGKVDCDLVAAITHWTESRPREPMVFALDHLYTADGLKLDLLKGNDRRTARHLVDAAEAAGCRVHFGQVSRHLLQFADDGSYGRWQYRDKSENVNYEVGETYEDEVRVDQWRSVRGKRVAVGPLALDDSMLVSTTPLEEWKPTREEYEGYTGNEGNTLERWYHKSAVVVWSARDHFDFLARTGMDAAVKDFLKLLKKLPRLAEDELEPACNDCVALAGAIIREWPERSDPYRARNAPEEGRLLEFAAALPQLEDPELVGEFLQCVARRDRRLPLEKLILDCCRRFGADVMAPVLEEALTVEPTRSWGASEMESIARAAVWLRALACDRSQGGMSADQLARLIGVAASRFGDSLKRGAARYHYESGDDDVATFTELMKAALAAGDESGFSELLQLRRDLPDVFEVRGFDIQVCESLIKWADKRFDQRPAALAGWLAEIRDFLEAATRELPQPPTDFARPADTNCMCPPCRELAVFLKDPTQESGKIQSRKQELEHLQHQIRQQKLDVDATLDRSTRPFSLVLVKTMHTHQRAVELHHADQERLRSLAQS